MGATLVGGIAINTRRQSDPEKEWPESTNCQPETHQERMPAIHPILPLAPWLLFPQFLCPGSGTTLALDLAVQYEHVFRAMVVTARLLAGTHCPGTDHCSKPNAADHGADMPESKVSASHLTIRTLQCNTASKHRRSDYPHAIRRGSHHLPLNQRGHAALANFCFERAAYRWPGRGEDEGIVDLPTRAARPAP